MSMPVIFILNGPNLNMLGIREPHIYGRQTLQDVEKICRDAGEEYGLDIDFRQSNHEGMIVDWLHESYRRVGGIVINAGAFTHTSLAIHDALKLLMDVPIAEVHISNPKEREEFRHFSYIESVADFHFTGHGIQGYVMAIEAIAERLGKHKK